MARRFATGTLPRSSIMTMPWLMFSSVSDKARFERRDRLRCSIQAAPRKRMTTVAPAPPARRRVLIASYWAKTCSSGKATMTISL